MHRARDDPEQQCGQSMLMDGFRSDWSQWTAVVRDGMEKRLLTIRATVRRQMDDGEREHCTALRTECQQLAEQLKNMSRQLLGAEQTHKNLKSTLQHCQNELDDTTGQIQNVTKWMNAQLVQTDSLTVLASDIQKRLGSLTVQLQVVGGLKKQISALVDQRDRCCCEFAARRKDLQMQADCGDQRRALLSQQLVQLRHRLTALKVEVNERQSAAGLLAVQEMEVNRSIECMLAELGRFDCMLAQQQKRNRQICTAVDNMQKHIGAFKELSEKYESALGEQRINLTVARSAIMDGIVSGRREVAKMLDCLEGGQMKRLKLNFQLRVWTKQKVQLTTALHKTHGVKKILRTEWQRCTNMVTKGRRRLDDVRRANWVCQQAIDTVNWKIDIGRANNAGLFKQCQCLLDKIHRLTAAAEHQKRANEQNIDALRATLKELTQRTIVLDLAVDERQRRHDKLLASQCNDLDGIDEEEVQQRLTQAVYIKDQRTRLFESRPTRLKLIQCRAEIEDQQMALRQQDEARKRMAADYDARLQAQLQPKMRELESLTAWHAKLVHDKQHLQTVLCDLTIQQQQLRISVFDVSPARAKRSPSTGQGCSRSEPSVLSYGTRSSSTMDNTNTKRKLFVATTPGRQNEQPPLDDILPKRGRRSRKPRLTLFDL